MVLEYLEDRLLTSYLFYISVGVKKNNVFFTYTF